MRIADFNMDALKFFKWPDLVQTGQVVTTESLARQWLKIVSEVPHSRS